MLSVRKNEISQFREKAHSLTGVTDNTFAYSNFYFSSDIHGRILPGGSRAACRRAWAKSVSGITTRSLVSWLNSTASLQMNDFLSLT